MHMETSRACEAARTRGLLGLVTLSALLTAALLMAVLLTFAAPLPVRAQEESAPMATPVSRDAAIFDGVLDEALRP